MSTQREIIGYGSYGPLTHMLAPTFGRIHLTPDEVRRENGHTGRRVVAVDTAGRCWLNAGNIRTEPSWTTPLRDGAQDNPPLRYYPQRVADFLARLAAADAAEVSP